MAGKLIIKTRNRKIVISSLKEVEFSKRNCENNCIIIYQAYTIYPVLRLYYNYTEIVRNRISIFNDEIYSKAEYEYKKKLYLHKYI